MKRDEKKTVGLGEVVYSVNDDPPRSKTSGQTKQNPSQDVEQADKESFPASDPPAFTGSTAKSEKHSPEGDR